MTLDAVLPRLTQCARSDRNRTRAAAIAFTFSLLFSGLQQAPARAAEINMGIATNPASIDPHFLNSPFTRTISSSIFEGLTNKTAVGDIVPALAEKWEQTNPTTWVFHLRKGVKFHNGASFTADDFKATYDRLPNVPNAVSPFTGYLRSVDKVDIVDPFTIKFTTKYPDANLPNSLSYICVISKEFANAQPGDFNSGKATFGTGPFKFVSFTPGSNVSLVRNDDYWGEKPVWDKATFRIVADAGARVAALLAGDLDIVALVPTAMFDRLKEDQRIELLRPKIGLRPIYLYMNQERDQIPEIKDADGNPLKQNPLKDVRVRRALSLAIDREQITSRIMGGSADAVWQWMPENSAYYYPDIPVPKAQPQEAIALLKEAGYPNGFEIMLAGPNDNYVNDVALLQGIAQMWQRIGIKANVQVMPNSMYSSRAVKAEFPTGMTAVGLTVDDALAPLRFGVVTKNTETGYGPNNHGRYSNPKIDKLTEQAEIEPDFKKRYELLREATKMMLDDVAVIPLYNQKVTWAIKRSLTYVARGDDHTRPAEIYPRK